MKIPRPIPDTEIGEVGHDIPCPFMAGHRALRVRRHMKRHVRVYDVCFVCKALANRPDERLANDQSDATE